jgi:hypothetical protein
VIRPLIRRDSTGGHPGEDSSLWGGSFPDMEQAGAKGCTAGPRSERDASCPCRLGSTPRRRSPRCRQRTSVVHARRVRPRDFRSTSARLRWDRTDRTRDRRFRAPVVDAGRRPPPPSGLGPHHLLLLVSGTPGSSSPSGCSDQPTHRIATQMLDLEPYRPISSMPPVKYPTESDPGTESCDPTPSVE